MASKIEDLCPGRSTAATANFPGGSYKDRTSVGVKNGTPLRVNWANDLLGFLDGILSKAETNHNGTPDTAASSQRLNTLLNLSKRISGTGPYLNKAAICSQDFFSLDTSDPCGGVNYYDTGDIIFDACIVFAEGDDNPGIAYLQTNGTITMLTRNGVNPGWNFDGSFGKSDLSLTFPSTPISLHGIACDGTSLFVAWLNDTHHMVTAFALNNLSGSASWTCDTGIVYIPVTGHNSRLIVSSSTSLALLVESSSSDPRRRIITITKSTGTLIGNGTGSYVSGYGADFDPRSRPISLFDHIWWLQYQDNDATYAFYLMSAKISNPATSDFASVNLGNFNSEGEMIWPKAIAYTRGLILISTFSGSIQIYNPVANSLYVDTIDIDYKPLSNYESTDADVMCCSDGQNIWFSGFGSNDDETPTKIYQTLYKIPTGPLAQGVKIGNTPGLSSSSVVLNESVVSQFTVPQGRMVYDGQAIWVLNRNGHIYRITNPETR